MSKGPTFTPRIQNRRAHHDYEVLEQVECGISLTGCEVKSLRAGQASLDGAYATVRGLEVFLVDMNISPYERAGYAPQTPKRERKLLLRRSEIKKLVPKVTQKGLTLIPLAVYFSERGWAKVLIALCRGKRTHDKRDDLKEREDKRAMERAMRRR